MRAAEVSSQRPRISDASGPMPRPGAGLLTVLTDLRVGKAPGHHEPPEALAPASSHAEGCRGADKRVAANARSRTARPTGRLRPANSATETMSPTRSEKWHSTQYGSNRQGPGGRVAGSRRCGPFCRPNRLPLGLPGAEAGGCGHTGKGRAMRRWTRAGGVLLRSARRKRWGGGQRRATQPRPPAVGLRLSPHGGCARQAEHRGGPASRTGNTATEGGWHRLGGAGRS